MKRLALAILMVAAAVAQQPQQPPQGPGPADQPDVNDTGDAPDRGVARISAMNGNVSVRRGDSGELVEAVLNAPLTATDRVETAEGARAEIEFDSANAIRLGPSSEVRLSELAYGHFQIQVATGTTSFRVLRDNSAQVEISTPSVSVHPARAGAYRVTVNPDGTSEVTVRSGEADVFSPRGSQKLHPGQTMLARGSASDPEFQMTAQTPQDDIDRWASERDRQVERAASPRYVSPDVYGTEDLDGNGRWENDPQYGNVWVPTVDAGWAPYRCGRWVWLDYYGWSWVGCESWGWAPYHYGNWYYGSLGWAWYPGAIHSRYYWRPAMVGFFGWGGGVGVGIGFGNVGWVPLAPYERFHPWYGRGFTGTNRFNNVTIVNNTNIVNTYRNARFTNSVTSVRANDFGHVGVNNNNFVHASAGDISRAGMMRGSLPMRPSRESNQFTNRAVNTQGLPRTNDNARFYSRGTSPAGQPGTANRSFDAGRTQQPGFQQQQRNNNDGGWRRFEGNNNGGGNPGGGNFNRGSQTPQAQQTPQYQQPRYNNQPGSFGGAQTPQQQPRQAQPQQPQFNRGGYGSQQPRGGQQQPLRISPPIVQQRGGGAPSQGQAPRQGGGGGGGGFHGGGGGGGSHGGGGGHGGGGHR